MIHCIHAKNENIIQLELTATGRHEFPDLPGYFSPRRKPVALRFAK